MSEEAVFASYQEPHGVVAEQIAQQVAITEGLARSAAQLLMREPAAPVSGITLTADEIAQVLRDRENRAIFASGGEPAQSQEGTTNVDSSTGTEVG
jgi:hypothetical protein